jgi:hypothetical protein
MRSRVVTQSTASGSFAAGGKAGSDTIRTEAGALAPYPVVCASCVEGGGPPEDIPGAARPVCFGPAPSFGVARRDCPVLAALAGIAEIAGQAGVPAASGPLVLRP